MPNKKKCASEWKALGYPSYKACVGYGSETQKAGTSSKEQSDKVGWDIAGSKNARMKNKIKKQSKY